MLIKRIAVLSSILCFCFLFCGAWSAQAAKALPPGMVIGDSEGMYATSDGEYYVDLVDILPGEVYEKEITIRSLDLEEPFSLGLMVEELETTGLVNWKDHITMTLNLDGEELYQGPLLGDASRDWTKTPLELGVCTYGTDQILKATFEIDSALTNKDFQAKSTLTFAWTFVGTKDQPEEPTKPTDSTDPTDSVDPAPSTDSSTSGELSKTNPDSPSGGSSASPSSGKRLPQTGEQIVYMFLTGLLLVLIALFLWRKRREEEPE